MAKQDVIIVGRQPRKESSMSSKQLAHAGCESKHIILTEGSTHCNCCNIAEGLNKEI